MIARALSGLASIALVFDNGIPPIQAPHVVNCPVKRRLTPVPRNAEACGHVKIIQKLLGIADC